MALARCNRGHRARVRAGAALKLSGNRDVRSVSALALARAGDSLGAEKLMVSLSRDFPLDTRVQKYWLPTIDAAVAKAEYAKLHDLTGGFHRGQPVMALTTSTAKSNLVQQVCRAEGAGAQEALEIPQTGNVGPASARHAQSCRRLQCRRPG